MGTVGDQDGDDQVGILGAADEVAARLGEARPAQVAGGQALDRHHPGLVGDAQVVRHPVAVAELDHRAGADDDQRRSGLQPRDLTGDGLGGRGRAGEPGQDDGRLRPERRRDDGDVAVLDAPVAQVTARRVQIEGRVTVPRTCEARAAPASSSPAAANITPSTR